MPSKVTPITRSVRPVPPPLGLYVRVGRNDHREMLNILSAGGAAFSGVVIDAPHAQRHEELREHVLERRLDVILDPCTQPSATAGGYSPKAHGKLPWGRARPHIESDFKDSAGRELIARLADFAIQGRFTQVLAPTHYIQGPEDPWLRLDIDNVARLRRRLDRNGGREIPIIYSLALPYAAFRNPEQRELIIEDLRSLPIAALWLKIDGLGSGNTPTATCKYIEAAREFIELGVPVVSDQMGGLAGLSLLAFGATGGLAHGLTLKERFDAGNWRRPSPSSPFSPPRRVYVPELDLMLEQRHAEALVGASSQTKARFGCRDSGCCARGVKDMLANPARHFLYQRSRQIQDLNGIPEELRPTQFLERYVRPASDQMARIADKDWPHDEAFGRKMREQRQRLDSLRVALGKFAQTHPARRFAMHPPTRASRELWR